MKLSLRWPTALVLVAAIGAIVALVVSGHMTIPAAVVDGLFAVILAFLERVLRSVPETSAPAPVDAAAETLRRFNEGELSGPPK